MVNLIISPEWIATVAPSGTVLRNHAISINQNGTIDAVAPAAELFKVHPQAERVELANHLVTPGLINMHSHASMSLLRGHGDDLNLADWLTTRIWPLEARLMSPQFVYDGAVLGAAEMLLGGITCFNDMYFYPEQVGQAALDLGIKANLGFAVIDFPTPYASTANDYLSKGLAARDCFRGEQNLSFSVAPHAPYTVSDATLQSVATLAAELEIPIHMHVHETQKELQDSIAQYGARPIARLHGLGLLDSNFVAAHCVHLSQDEIELLAYTQTNIVHCPHSNLKLGSGIAPTKAILEAGINLGIGTDGSASNNRLDLIAEARTACLIAKGASGDASAFNAHAALSALTINAAKALGKDQSIGSIEPGKLADLVAFDFSSFYNQPVHDPVAQLLYTSSREYVAYVWINGQLVAQKRQLVGSTPNRILSEVTARIPLWHNRGGEILSAVV